MGVKKDIPRILKKQISRFISDRRRTPTILQMEAAECGAAALGIILAYYGSYVPLEELRIACGVSRDGTKASNIARAARRFGLAFSAFCRDSEHLKQGTLPAIVHWENNHFVVVEGFGRNKVWLNDPATGPRSINYKDFERSYSGTVLTFEPKPDFVPGGRQASLIESLSIRLKGYGKAPLTYIILVSLFLVIPGLAIPLFLRFFVDQVLVRGFTHLSGPLFLGMITALILKVFITFLQGKFLLRLETKLALSTSSSFLWHVLRLPVMFFTQRYVGDISDRVAINDRIARLLSGGLSINLLNGIMIIFFLTVMTWCDLLLTGVSLCLALINIGALKLANRLRVDTNRRYQQDRGKLMGVTIAGLQMIETFKATGGESNFFSQWAGYHAKTIKSRLSLEIPTRLLAVVPSFVTSLSLGIILILGGVKVMEGSLSAGMLVAFQGLLLAFFEPITNLVNLGEQFQEIKADLNRLDDVLKAEPDLPAILPSPDSTCVCKEKLYLNGNIELKNISFGYNPLEAPLLKDIHFCLKSGSRAAIVGPTGSGKSTLVKLISGIYKPFSGEILIAGEPRPAKKQWSFTHSLSVVDQDIFLFEGTIKENLTLWDTTAPEIDIVAAARDACIHNDIMMRTGGYDGIVEEDGRNFSGGQRQRLEIARALVNNPSILILDEATSSLDPSMEEEIDKNLRRRGCTCLIIAHRLSTIRDSDEIIVLDKGCIAERGSHETLWKTGKIYPDLVEN